MLQGNSLTEPPQLKKVMNEESIFTAAIEIDAVEERAKYVAAECAGDEKLRLRVESLLEAHENKDSIFEKPAFEDKADAEQLNGVRRELGDFKIISELGRGGMGVVHEAHQKSLNRRVALKVLSGGLGLTAKAVMRFRREAEAAGRLHHTNIVPIYSTGEESGVHFYAMELIAGPSLDQVIDHLREENSGSDSDSASDNESHHKPLPEWVDETIAFESTHRLPQSTQKISTSSSSVAGSSSIATSSGYFGQVATMIADVADALEHAHDHGVIHRDIKPSNLLLGPDGRLSITDFGLARMLEQPGMTMTGEFVGSPLYMSPEQITAGRAPLDHRTDIYSLGATLYELLTLRPPFPGTRRDEVIAQVLSKEPKAPRRLNRRVPADLETICLKAIERDPNQRYQTAAVLASDLRAYVNHHAISVKRTGPVARVVKWVRRKPTLASLIGVVLMSLSIIGGLLYKERIAEREITQQRTLEYIMQGQLNKANEACDKAARLGAPREWFHRTRAHIELYRDHPIKAKHHLDQAESSGMTTATEALRAIVHFHVGEETAYFLALDALQGSEADTPDDRFYLGLAQMWCDPFDARDNLNSAYTLNRGSPAIRLPRAYANWQCAVDCPNPDQALVYAIEAIADAEACLEHWPDNPFASATLVQTLLTAVNICDDLGRPNLRNQYSQRLLKAGTDLKTSLDQVHTTLARYHFPEPDTDF